MARMLPVCIAGLAWIGAVPAQTTVLPLASGLTASAVNALPLVTQVAGLSNGVPTSTRQLPFFSVATGLPSVPVGLPANASLPSVPAYQARLPVLPGLELINVPVALPAQPIVPSPTVKSALPNLATLRRGGGVALAAEQRYPAGVPAALPGLPSLAPEQAVGPVKLRGKAAGGGTAQSAWVALAADAEVAD